jgi:EpsD family peptidyl-prolyl cis-trans isomerase
MKSVRPLIFGAAILLAACGSKNSSLPQGQVVATVDGKDITALELNNEMGRFGNATAGNDLRQQEALQRLIVRRLLVAEAERLGVDKTPQTAIKTTQAQQAALVEALAANFSKDVPQASAEEAEDYVRANPASFAQRKLFFVERLVAGTAPADLEAQLGPLHTLDAAETLLKSKQIPYRHVGAVIDTATIDPHQAAQISTVGSDDIFFNRIGKSVQISAIIATRTVPLEGSDATTVARNALNEQRTAAQVQERLAQIIKQAKGRVLINPSYTGKVSSDFK